MQEKYHFTKVFAAACLGMLLFGIVMISLGSILPELIGRFELNEMEAGSLASILPFGILTGSLLFGPIVDRYSYGALLIVCTLLVVAGLEGIAFAESKWVLQLSFFIIGAGGGALNGGTNALVADISADQPEKRSANLSFLGVFFGIGALGMPVLLGVLTEQYTYDAILTGIGLAVALPAVYFLSISFPRPKQEQGIPFREWLGLFKKSSLLLLAFTLFFQGALEGITNNWTTTYLQNSLGMGSANALYALSLFVGSLTVARLLLAGMLRRQRPYRVLTGSLGLILAACLLLWLATSPTWATAGLVLLGFGVAAGFPVVLSYVGDLYADISGTAFSLVFTISLLGNMLINFLMGLIARSLGVDILPLVMIGCLLGLALLLLFSLRSIAGKTKI